jgi:hypothetical protein
MYVYMTSHIYTVYIIYIIYMTHMMYTTLTVSQLLVKRRGLK